MKFKNNKEFFKGIIKNEIIKTNFENTGAEEDY